VSWYMLDNKEKIKGIIHYLIANGAKIRVFIKGENTLFTSRLMKVSESLKDVSSKIDNGYGLIIEKLAPESGNSLIQSAHDVILGFLVKEIYCRCLVRYGGIINSHPYYGFAINFPEFIEVQEKRREERFASEMLKLVSAEIKLERGLSAGKGV